MNLIIEWLGIVLGKEEQCRRDSIEEKKQVLLT